MFSVPFESTTNEIEIDENFNVITNLKPVTVSSSTEPSSENQE